MHKGRCMWKETGAIRNAGSSGLCDQRALLCHYNALREEGKEVGKDVNHLVTVNLFATITNANFDRDAIIARIKETLAVKEESRAKLVDPTGLPEAAVWNGNENEFDSKADSDEVGVLATENEDVRSPARNDYIWTERSCCLFQARQCPDAR